VLTLSKIFSISCLLLGYNFVSMSASCPNDDKTAATVAILLGCFLVSFTVSVRFASTRIKSHNY
jgi:hypothetical protein